MTATQAAMIMMSGNADLEDITITENGEYESVDHDGFGVVTVEVPTMMECAEEVAEILGVDTSQEWDCDDIKTKAQEVVDENEEMQECCDEVLDVIHEYDPTYDPHPVPPDPTNPTIPEKIQEIIDEESGFDPPIGTPIEDVLKIMGIGDTVEIEDNDYYFAVYAEGWYKSFTPSAYPQIDIKENSFYTATTPPNYDYGSLGWVIYVYSKATKELVTTVQLGTFQGFDAGEYVKLISLNINYTNKTMNGVYETDDPYPHTPIQISMSADLTRYITTTSPNPQYRVRNS